MKKRLFIFLLVVMSLVVNAREISIPEILTDFVKDFAKDPMAKSRAIEFGIRIKDVGDWHVTLDGKGKVTLKKGLPAIPSLYYVTDDATLRLIYSGRMSVLTAMGRARMSDPAPMDFGFMQGFSPAPDFLGWGVSFTFHFWTRGMPEVVCFGDSAVSRTVHGGQAKVLYYAAGLRTSWYGIRKGQHINREPRDQVNPFPTLVMMIRGEAEAKIGGRPVLLKKGMCVHIPAGTSHEFWNDREKDAEFIIVMFGKGA